MTIIKKSTLESIEYGITVFGLVLYSGAILVLILNGGINEGDTEWDLPNDNAVIKQCYLLFYFITLIMLSCRWQKTLYVITENPSVFIFIGLVTASITWSSSPSLTSTRAVAFLGTNLFGLYLASRYTLKQQVLLFTQAFGIIVLVSMIFALIMPKYGVMSGIHAGAWRGVYNHKNGLGKWMVLSTAIFFLQSIRNPKPHILIYLGLISSTLLLVMSKSSASVVNLFVVVIVFLVLKTWRWNYLVMVPATLLVTLLGSGFFLWFNSNSSVLFSSVGKDSSLSGRTELWSLAFESACKRPFFGYGYGSFWENPNGASIEIWQVINWRAPNAHNGFIDLFLGLGLAGVVILGIGFVNTFIQSTICLRRGKTSDEFWPLIFMIYFVLSNLSESALMLQNELFTVTYVTLAYSTKIQNSPRAVSILHGDTIQI